MIAAGVIHVHSAGNDGSKVEANNGVDYNNTYGIITNVSPLGLPVITNTFYHRPSSPHANTSINVGSTTNLSSDGAFEFRASYSHFGTGVDIWAPGTGIVSSFNETIPSFGAGNRSNYEHANGFIDSNYWQVNNSGTSMAAPQVTGILSLFLQINPGASPSVVKIWLQNNAAFPIMFTSGLTNDYTNTASISGSQPLFLKNPYVFSKEITVTGGLKIENGIVEFR
jgi:subtilisin family serine protease